MTIARIIEDLYNLKKVFNVADYFSNTAKGALFKGDKVEIEFEVRTRGVKEVVKSVFAKKNLTNDSGFGIKYSFAFFKCKTCFVTLNA